LERHRQDGHAIRREYVEDREITAWFLLDLSPSVDFGSVDSERVKRTVLVDFVATLARLLTRRGNRVGAIFYGSTIERTIPARGGRDQVLHLIDSLMNHPRQLHAPSQTWRLCSRRGSGRSSAAPWFSSSRTSSASPAGIARLAC